MKEKNTELIVALDFPDSGSALDMVKRIGDAADFYKVGLELFIRDGHKVIGALKTRGKKVFLDLKIHDIPNTAKHAVLSAVATGADIIDIHVQGGLEMMRESAEALAEEAEKRNMPRPLLIGVTLLTSLDEAHLKRFRIEVPAPQDYVVQMALLAQQAGLDGVVSSPNETLALKNAAGADFVTVTPGIRLAGGEVGDQKRIMTPEEAAKTGTDYIVVGRPITRSDDPKKTAELIQRMLGQS